MKTQTKKEIKKEFLNEKEKVGELHFQSKAMLFEKLLIEKDSTLVIDEFETIGGWSGGYFATTHAQGIDKSIVIDWTVGQKLDKAETLQDLEDIREKLEKEADKVKKKLLKLNF